MSKVLKPDQVAIRTAPHGGHGPQVDGGVSLEGARAAAGEAERAERDAMELLRHARLEARRVLERAAAVAEERLALAEERRRALDEECATAREEARREGYEAGYAEGLEAGRAQGMQAFLEAVDALHRALAVAKQEQQAVLQGAQKDLIALAVALAEKLIRRELSCDAEFPLSVLRSLLPALESDAVVGVRVSPATRARWEEAGVSFEALAAERCLRVDVDPSLEPGDVLIDTEWGFVDGRLRTRWRRILSGIGLTEAGDVVPNDEPA